MGGLTMWWLIPLFCLIVPVAFYMAFHFHQQRQYTKKQLADALLFPQVMNSLNEHLSVEEAVKRFQITDHAQLLACIKQATSLPLTENDRLKLLRNGEETYSAFFEEIKKAKHHIHILFYIFRDDNVGQEFIDLLKKKAREGVIVRVLVDGVGSHALSEETKRQLKRAGIKLEMFAPPKLSFLFHLNYRNHRKVTVIDGRVGFLGGLNIGDEYLHRDPQKGFWRDQHLLIEGESVLLLQRIFATDWYYAKNEKISEDQHYFPHFKDKHTFQQTEPTQELKQKTILAQVVPSGPDMKRDVARDAFVEMINSAQKRVWIGTPYFIPDKKILQAIKLACARGVKVTLLVPEQTDNWFVQHAAFYYYQKLLACGAQVLFYQKGFYHAKVALVDDLVAKVGSANLDQRSFHLSFEAGLFIYDPTVCHQVKQLFLQDFQESRALQPIELTRRTIGQQILTAFSLLLTPWL